MPARTNCEPVDACAGKRPLSNKFLFACLVYFIILKLCISLFMPPLPDEAYYWLWGQFPSISYFDHPGLAGWLMAVSSALFGNSLVALRIGGILSTIGSACFLYLYSMKIRPNDEHRTWLFVLVMVAASPTIFIWSTIAYHDHLLIFLLLASMYHFTCFFSDHAQQQRPKTWQLYLAAFFLGLAGLTKYSAIFPGIAIVLLVIGHQRLRTLLLTPHIYLAGTLAVSMQTPTLVWNFSHEFASFWFHFNDRHGSNWLSGFNPDSFFNYILSTIVLFGPFLLIPLGKIFTVGTRSDFAGTGTWIARLIIVLSIGTFATISFFAFTLWYWNSIAYIFLLSMLPFLNIGRRVAAAHVIYGLILTTLVTVNYMVLPLPTLFGTRVSDAAMIYDWDRVATEVTNAESRYSADFVATANFQTASLLSFTLDRADITAIESRVSQFDIWEQRDRLAGGSAIILRDEFGDLVEAKKRFDSIEKLSEFHVERFGYALLKYELYLGTNYRPRVTNPVR